MLLFLLHHFLLFSFQLVQLSLLVYIAQPNAGLPLVHSLKDILAHHNASHLLVMTNTHTGPVTQASCAITLST